ncbi:AAA family ATPase [Coralliovum pocilloporae]|uniref:AAA family ATPase n=1 Tax=Coralliovum pocilloporae TaxID=3066369 RepID=UPI00330788BB
MLFVGNERGYGSELARHLMNGRDNEHVTVHSVDGFIADNLHDAFAEVEAVAAGTQCQNYLYSLSLNPPQSAQVPVRMFEETIARIEQEFGLAGQPRAIVFHEKKGRRHCHCVWSRINAQQMRAINLSLTKSRLMRISYAIFQEQGWEMPKGLEDWRKRDPNGYTRAQAEQAKRAAIDPQETKKMFVRCWQQSDSRASFAAALWSEGYCLAQGDRRGFVAIDGNGKVHSLSRWCGVKSKELNARLGDFNELPTVKEAIAILHGTEQAEQSKRTEQPNADFADRRDKLVAKQRAEREALQAAQEQRRIRETRQRQERLPTGMKRVWARLSGSYDRLLKELETEALANQARDEAEHQTLIEKHLREYQHLTPDSRFDPQHDRDIRNKLDQAFAAALTDTRQELILPEEPLPFTKAQLQRQPVRILDYLSDKQSRFTALDIKRSLARFIDDPLSLRTAIDTVMASNELVQLSHAGTIDYTTRSYKRAEDALFATTSTMHKLGNFGVSSRHVQWVIRYQNAIMQRGFGGELSDEQQKALHHILDNNQFANVFGIAGAGKSIMLNAARIAWEKQGIRVHGAALAGIAADGLQASSGIESRTLASLELSWENGNQPIRQGDVLVIDEAGMIGTRQLSRIATKINEIGAKLVLVGDPEQLQPIEAGQPFRQLVKRLDAATLTEVHRQKSDWQKQASLDLSQGQLEKAVTAYQENGSVHVDHNKDSALSALVASYLADRKTAPDASRLAFAHRRKDVYDINQAIRAELRHRMALPNEEYLIKTDSGPRMFSIGDRIVLTRNDTSLGVKNGMLGTITKMDHGLIELALDHNKQTSVTFNPRRYRTFDHGYAVTIHKSQGATVDRGFVLASKRLDPHLTYVAMTRHREKLNVFVNEKDKPRSWGFDLKRSTIEADRRQRQDHQHSQQRHTLRYER